MEIAGACRARVGEKHCGDSYVVCKGQNDTLIAVIDGLGHGPEAAHAAEVASAYVSVHRDDPLSELMRGLHQELARTRGAAVTMLRACPAAGEIQHAAVGNVEVVGFSREPVRPVCVPGIVGSNMRKVVERSFPVRPGDLVVAHTDGVSRRFELSVYRDLPVQKLADTLLSEWGKDHDDATCVAIRI